MHTGGNSSTPGAPSWKTPLFLACLREVPDPEVVAVLREYGADPYHGWRYMPTPRSQAYDRYLLSGFDALGDLPAPEPPQTDARELTDEEMEATIAAVRAIADRDGPALEAMLAHDPGDGDPYMWTHDYGRWGDVHLVFPPGDPRSWVIHVFRGDEDDWDAIPTQAIPTQQSYLPFVYPGETLTAWASTTLG